MMFIGSLAKFKDTGEIFIYAGINLCADEDTLIGGLPLKSGTYGFTPQFEYIGYREYTHIEDDNGDIIVGEFASLIGGFFGVIDPERLDEKDYQVLHETLESGANNTVTLGRLR